MTLGSEQLAGRAVLRLKALANNLRFRIMIVLTEREASPKELSELLGYDLKRICEHIKVLEDGGFIELCDTDSRLGGTIHVYRAKARPLIDTPESEDLSLKQREGISDAISQGMIVDLLRATESGSMDTRIDRVLIRIPLLFDREAFSEADAAAVEFMDKLLEIEARSNGRRAETGEKGTNVASAISVFPLPESAA